MIAEIEGVRYRSVAWIVPEAPHDESRACAGCVAEAANKQSICDAVHNALDPKRSCPGVIWIEDTDQALAKYVAQKLTS